MSPRRTLQFGALILSMVLPTIATPHPMNPDPNPTAAKSQSASLKIDSFDEAFKFASRGRHSDAEVSAFESWYGANDLKNGTNPKEDDLRFVFAVTAADPHAKVTASSEDGTWSLELHHVGKANLFVGAATLPETAGFKWSYHIGDSKLGGGDLEAYTYPADSKPQKDVPKGQLIQQPAWHSTVYPGTTRDWWIYVPAQYDATKPACLYVIQDAQWSRGYWSTTLDNLLAKKDIPVAIAVFLKPGSIHNDLDNRSVEYDTVSDRYATMLETEIIPEVAKQYNIRKDAKGHLISGLSSGGICSFNAAWFRPDLFHKVISWIGSFTNLQGGPDGVSGGNTFPARIRKQRGWDRKGEPKPIRVFLQDGANDLDNAAGNWPLANNEMARALEYGGYEYKFVFGHGFHSDKQGRVNLPDALRWIWKDEPK